MATQDIAGSIGVDLTFGGTAENDEFEVAGAIGIALNNTGAVAPAFPTYSRRGRSTAASPGYL